MRPRILFQGDSITDCGRDRTDAHGLGSGYPLLVSAALGEGYECLNRGVSGNRIVDLYARIKADFINLAPDCASILIGVNDVWHELSRSDGVDAEKFERVYLWLLEELFAACPKTRLLLLSPFVTDGTATVSTPDMPDRRARFAREVALRGQVVRRVAERYSLPFLDLQSAFDRELSRHPAEEWTVDGVHPTARGHALLAQLWLSAFEGLCD